MVGDTDTAQKDSPVTMWWTFGKPCIGKFGKFSATWETDAPEWEIQWRGDLGLPIPLQTLGKQMGHLGKSVGEDCQ